MDQESKKNGIITKPEKRTNRTNNDEHRHTQEKNEPTPGNERENR